jgi:hypothetical protein
MDNSRPALQFQKKRNARRPSLQTMPQPYGMETPAASPNELLSALPHSKARFETLI